MTVASVPFRWSSIIAPVYLPTLLFSAGEGGIIPLIPRLATELGSTLAAAGFVAGLLMIGTLIGDIPSGALVARIGERNAMLWGSVLTLVGLLMILAATEVWLLGCGVLLIGVATAVFALARHAFLTTAVPLPYRARALSTLGGVFRAGMFTGPLVAAALLPVIGSDGVVWVSIATVASVVAVLLLLPDPETRLRQQHRARESGVEPLTVGEQDALDEQRGLWASLWRYRGVYGRLAVGAGLLSMLRAGRSVVLPLWAVSIGMDVSATAFWIGVAACVDFALFYTSGHIMDRFGRFWGAVPPMLVMSAAFFALSLSHDAANATTWFIAVALCIGVGNGFSSGVVLTLSSDMAPPGNPAPFLGGWRFTTDGFAALTPIVVGGFTALASLSVGVAAIGFAGLIGAGMLARWIPRIPPEMSKVGGS